MQKIILAAAIAFGISGGAEATVLTFDGNICNDGAACGNFSFIDQTYGDAADVDVQYNRDITGQSGPDARMSFWDTAYSDLTNVAWGGLDSATGVPEIFLQPLGGGSITLLGFDLGAWPLATSNTQVTIVDGLDNVLFSSGPITIGAGGVHRHFAFDLTSNSGIGVEFGPDGSNVGIDNLAFVTGVAATAPEPAAWALMVGGFGMAGSAIRRRSKIYFT